MYVHTEEICKNQTQSRASFSSRPLKSKGCTMLNYEKWQKGKLLEATTVLHRMTILNYFKPNFYQHY
jgi:hypothetical protein